jgi:hypothetical protein
VFSHDLKLKRAREHIEALDGEIESWLGTDAYTISREIDPETGYTVRRAQVQSLPPDELGLLVGDVVQYLRSALDHVVYFLAERHAGPLTPDAEEALMFPIVGNENRKGERADGAQIFQRALERGRLDGVPDPARAFIKSEQPYHWGDPSSGDPWDAYRYHWLWLIHDLNRIDKHRRLAITTAWLGLPYATTPAGVTPRITFSHAEGPVQDGDVLVTYSGADKGVDAHFSRSVAIDEGTARESDALTCLDNLRQRVEWIVANLARYA